MVMKMSKVSMFVLHSVATFCLLSAGCYIVLNETGRLDKVKRDAYNKVMDVKDDIKRKMK
jgi:hypothetical protein